MNIIRRLNFFGALVCFFAHASAGLNATASPENSGLVVTGGSGVKQSEKENRPGSGNIVYMAGRTDFTSLSYW